MRLAALLLGLLAACGGAPSGTAWQERSQPIVDGTAAPHDHAAVALVGRRVRCDEREPMLLCSGALVGPDLVLTAAHCLDVFGEEGQYEVFFGDALPDGRYVHVRQAWIHPAYDPETHAWDAALLRLAEPMEVQPYALPTQPPAPDAIARAIGYGETRDEGAPAGIRRQGATRITEVTAAAFLAAPAPAMSCTGDSGGPVLVEEAGGEVLAGITASGDIACRSEALAVRVDVLLDDFLGPALATVPAADAGAHLPLEALCTAECESAADCPAGLACVPDASGSGRCMLLALQEGSFDYACRNDDECSAGSTCARLEPEGADACRCFTPCATLPGPAAQSDRNHGSGGCSSSGAPAFGELLALASFAFTSIAGARRTSAAGTNRRGR